MLVAERFRQLVPNLCTWVRIPSGIDRETDRERSVFPRTEDVVKNPKGKKHVESNKGEKKRKKRLERSKAKMPSSDGA